MRKDVIFFIETSVKDGYFFYFEEDQHNQNLKIGSKDALIELKISASPSSNFHPSPLKKSLKKTIKHVYNFRS